MRLERLRINESEVCSLRKKPPTNKSDRTLNMWLLPWRSLVAEVCVDTEFLVGNILDTVVERARVNGKCTGNVPHRRDDDLFGFVGNDRPDE